MKIKKIHTSTRTHQNSKRPEPSLVPQGPGGVKKEGRHQQHQHQRVDVSWNAQFGTVQKRKYRNGPNHAENGRHFDNMLFGQMVSGVHFED